uniref:Uncharacterized protein n=1 Tax=Globodera rostochiensis TaxID=31243 RepID=A0A914HUN8_GLORO
MREENDLMVANVKLFLENGQQQNIDVTGRNDAIELIIASSEGMANVVRFLLSKGARADRTDANGNTALDEAVENGHGEIMELHEFVSFLR